MTGFNVASGLEGKEDLRIAKPIFQDDMIRIQKLCEHIHHIAEGLPEYQDGGHRSANVQTNIKKMLSDVALILHDMHNYAQRAHIGFPSSTFQKSLEHAYLNIDRHRHSYESRLKKNLPHSVLVPTISTVFDKALGIVESMQTILEQNKPAEPGYGKTDFFKIRVERMDN